MRTLVCAATILVSFCSTAPLLAQSTSSLLVLSKRDHTLAVIDPNTLQVTARIPVGDVPLEVIASSDGTRAYVSNYGFGALHTLAVIDLVDDKPLPSVDLGALRGPHGLVFQSGETWFTAEAAKALGRYNPNTGKIDLILGTGQNRTHMIWVAKDGQQIVTTNVSSGTLSIFTQEPIRMPSPPPGDPSQGGSVPPGPPPGASPMPQTGWNQTVVRVGNGSEGFDVSPDGKEIWVANAQDGTVSVVSLPDKKVLQTLQVNTPRANRLKFSPDGQFALVSSGPDLVVIDAASRAVKTRVCIGHGSAGILIEPSGSHAFVACGPDNYVAVVDLRTMKVTGHIDAGGEPDGLAWAAR